MKITKKYLQKLIETELKKAELVSLIEQVDVSGREFGPTKKAALDRATSKDLKRVLEAARIIQTQAKEFERAVMNLQETLGAAYNEEMVGLFGEHGATLMQLLGYMEFIPHGAAGDLTLEEAFQSITSTITTLMIKVGYGDPAIGMD